MFAGSLPLKPHSTQATLNTPLKPNADATIADAAIADAAGAEPSSASERRHEQYRQVEAALRSAGLPLSRSELRTALALEAGESELLHGLVGREPFIEVDARRWGLIDRDLPGGEIGFRQALDAIRDANSKDTESAYLTVQKLSRVHATWSYEMAASAFRVHKTQALSFPRTLSGIKLR